MAPFSKCHSKQIDRSGFGVQGSGSRVHRKDKGLRIKDKGLGGIESSKLKGEDDLGLRENERMKDSGFRIKDSEFSIQDEG